MLHRIRAVSALLVAVLLFTGANGLLTTLLAIQALDHEFPPAVVGTLASAYFAGFILACVFAGRVVRRVGHNRAYAGFAAIMSISVLLYPFFVHPIAWLALRMLSGFCHAVLMMTTESWLNTVAESDERSRLFSVYRMVDLGSVTLAQFSLALFDPLAAASFSLIAISITAALVPITLTRITGPSGLVEAHLDVRGLVGNSPLAVAGVVAVGFMSGSLWGVSPLYIAANGFAPHVTGWFISAVIVGGAVLQWPLGRLSDRYDRRKVIVGVSGAAAAAATALYVLGLFGKPPVGILIGGAFVLGGSALPLYGLAISHANDRAANGEFVRIASGLILFFGIGAMLGPALSATAVRAFGPTSLFLCLAAVGAALSLFGIHRLRRKSAASAEEKTDFVSISRASPTAFRLDPRSTPENPRGRTTTSCWLEVGPLQAVDLKDK